MKIVCEIEAYELNGKERKFPDPAYLMTVSRHWNSPRLVVLKMGATEMTFTALDLKKAIDACTI